MELSAALADLPGVESALVALGTSVTLDLLPEMGYTRPDAAGPNDLVVALHTAVDAAMVAALDRLESDLDTSARVWKGTLQTLAVLEGAPPNTRGPMVSRS